MKPKVEAEIERLIKEDIIIPIKYFDWAAPVVPLLKPDRDCRLC